MDIEKKNEILKARGSQLRNAQREFPTPVEKRDVRPIDKVVFQPNIFGWPSNDIDVMNTTTNPEVKIALERRNLKMAAENGCEDDDVVLDTMKRNDESENDYFDRMQPIIEDAKKQSKSTKT